MRLINILLVLVMIAGCTNHKKVPPDIIPQPEMEKILWDMIQADRFANSFVLKERDTASKMEVAKEYAKVFSIHGISQEEFVRSYKFYLGRPDLTKTMFDSISARADRRKGDVYKFPVKKDSLHVNRDSLLLKKDSVNPKRGFIRAKRDSLLKKGKKDSLIKK
jgi:hypothetical protein